MRSCVRSLCRIASSKTSWLRCVRSNVAASFIRRSVVGRTSVRRIGLFAVTRLCREFIVSLERRRSDVHSFVLASFMHVRSVVVASLTIRS